jgi:hypothetical protein
MPPGEKYLGAERFRVHFAWSVDPDGTTHLTLRTIGGLLTRLDGLPSDELFAIPATRTASVYVESSRARDFRDVASMRAGCNHDINPTCQHRP